MPENFNHDSIWQIQGPRAVETDLKRAGLFILERPTHGLGKRFHCPTPAHSGSLRLIQAKSSQEWTSPDSVDTAG